MTELILFLVIVVILAFHMWTHREHVRERRHLTSLIVAKNVTEVRVLDNEPATERIPTPKTRGSYDDDFWAEGLEQVGI